MGVGRWMCGPRGGDLLCVSFNEHAGAEWTDRGEGALARCAAHRAARGGDGRMGVDGRACGGAAEEQREWGGHPACSGGLHRLARARGGLLVATRFCRVLLDGRGPTMSRESLSVQVGRWWTGRHMEKKALLLWTGRTLTACTFTSPEVLSTASASANGRLKNRSTVPSCSL